MSTAMLPRLALRQSRVAIQRRAASTTSEAANAAASGASKAKEAASETAAKAQEGLSRVSSTANSALSSAGSALSSVGGRTGQAITFVQSLVPPTLYYARVVGELGKLIYTGRGMQPPSTQTIQTYFSTIQNAFRNPSALVSRGAQTAAATTDAALTNPQSFMTRLRDFDHAALATVAVVAAETIGFFSVGEIIGRFQIVGYRGETHAHH